MGARPVRDVVVNTHGERIGLLKHHPYPAAQDIGVYIPHIRVSVSIQEDTAFNAASLHQIIHTVQALEQRGLAAARRADEGGYRPGRDIQGNIPESLELPVP